MKRETTIETIRSAGLGEEYYKVNHKSGVTLLLSPMKGFSTAYALFGTNYGSMDVTFRTDTAENTIVVPTEAILTSNHVQYVFVVEDGAAKYVEVTTGLTGSGVTEVTSGLTEGEQLVTVGQAYLSDGDPVRVVSGEE